MAATSRVEDVVGGRDSPPPATGQTTGGCFPNLDTIEQSTDEHQGTKFEEMPHATQIVGVKDLVELCPC